MRSNTKKPYSVTVKKSYILEPIHLTTFPAISTECGCGRKTVRRPDARDATALYSFGVLYTGTLMDLARLFSRRTMDSSDNKCQLERQSDLCF